MTAPDPRDVEVARLRAALALIAEHAEFVCRDPEFKNILGQELCRSCEDVLPNHGAANSDCIGWAGMKARAALAPPPSARR